MEAFCNSKTPSISMTFVHHTCGRFVHLSVHGFPLSFLTRNHYRDILANTLSVRSTSVASISSFQRAVERNLRPRKSRFWKRSQISVSDPWRDGLFTFIHLRVLSSHPNLSSQFPEHFWQHFATIVTSLPATIAASDQLSSPLSIAQ